MVKSDSLKLSSSRRALFSDLDHTKLKLRIFMISSARFMDWRRAHEEQARLLRVESGIGYYSFQATARGNPHLQYLIW